MNTSDSISKIAPALLQAQRAITFAVKDSKNPAFRSTYADLSSVIDACKPALNEAGVFFTQMPAPSEPGTIALTTRLIHESGEWIESTATCPLPKNDPQGYGSANTYLRRYSLAAAVGLYQDDDDGNAARNQAPAPQQRQQPAPQKVATVSEKQAADIQALIEEVGADKVEFLAWVAKVSGLPVKTVNDIPAADVDPITKALERKRNTVREHA